jgi:hypothetical protein
LSSKLDIAEAQVLVTSIHASSKIVAFLLSFFSEDLSFFFFLFFLLALDDERSVVLAVFEGFVPWEEDFLKSREDEIDFVEPRIDLEDLFLLSCPSLDV